MQEGKPEMGMAGGPGNPVALLRVYMQFGKLKEAGKLALDILRRWLYEASSLLPILQYYTLNKGDKSRSSL